MRLLLPAVNCEFYPVKENSDISSDSDYDDDIVDEVIQQKKKVEPCKKELPCNCDQHIDMFGF